jgi:uncharacterized protein YbaR (Trm112 family)
MSLIDPGLLKLLRCPETRLPVAEADAALVTDLNQRIAAGTLKNGGGKAVTDKLDGALVRSDRAVVYPIRNRIPLMLVEEAIPLA